MTTKHTAGPWITKLTYGGTDIESKNQCIDICFIEHEFDDKESNANARLIALAPDLFDVLQEFKIASDIQDNNFDGDAWLKRVDAVMAKVTGVNNG